MPDFGPLVVAGEDFCREVQRPALTGATAWGLRLEGRGEARKSHPDPGASRPQALGSGPAQGDRGPSRHRLRPWAKVSKSSGSVRRIRHRNKQVQSLRPPQPVTREPKAKAHPGEPEHEVRRTFTAAAGSGYIQWCSTLPFPGPFQKRVPTDHKSRSVAWYLLLSCLQLRRAWAEVGQPCAQSFLVAWGTPDFTSHNDLVEIHLSYETDFASE